MALTDLNTASPALAPAPRLKKFEDNQTGIPFQALARLPVLHREAGNDLHMAQFLARVPQACLVLMLAGAAALIWAARNGATLEAGFDWAILVLIGIVAMTRCHIRSMTHSVPLKDTAWDLRMTLLYAGAAWGMGAFFMPGLHAAMLGFVAVPCLACALILRDEKGVIAFCAPATLATACALLLGTGGPLGLWLACTTLAAGAAIISLSMLQCIMHRRRNALPDLALR